MKYSFVVPLYNRPMEVETLLRSFVAYAKDQDYELIVVEDASVRPAEALLRAYAERVCIKYVALPRNVGPAAARNAGAKRAGGEYLLFIDSDTALTGGYFAALEEGLRDASLLFAGGGEALPLHSPSWQQAVHHSMCAWLATGGIRGRRRSMERFKPRTHNMLVRRSVFEEVGGFNPDLRYGEDIDFSLRMEQAGYGGRLLPELRVLHHRKATPRAFFCQVYHSGCARVRLAALHPGSTKWVHLLPAAFFVAEVIALLAAVLGWWWPFIGFAIYAVALWGEILHASGRPWVSLQAVAAALLQLTGYGLGYLRARAGL